MIVQHLFRLFAAGCDANATFFGIPAWYKYLVNAGRMTSVTDSLSGIQSCDLKEGFQWKTGDLALVGMGVLDICLRIAALVAVGFVIYGGISYITSEGSPDQTKNAQTTIINALIGLVIAIIATALVSFIGQKLG
ncbi:MAG: hypothetical protein ABWX94_01500 [Candidatus Saccharimonadales bacterium]